MTDRELDLRIAQQVMGMPIHPDGDSLLLHDPPMFMNCKLECRHYTTDPAADYAVLVKVRESWTYHQKEQFWEEVWTAWKERRRKRPDDAQHNHPSEAMYMSVGDYSRAALAALSPNPAPAERE